LPSTAPLTRYGSCQLARSPQTSVSPTRCHSNAEKRSPHPLAILDPNFPAYSLDPITHLPTMSSDEQPSQPEQPSHPSHPIVQDAKAVVDKIADAAPRADPRDLAPASALDGLKNIDRTILRLNKYVIFHTSIYHERAVNVIQTHRFPRRSIRLPLHLQLLALHPRLPAIQIHHPLIARHKGPRTHPPRLRRCQNPRTYPRQQRRRRPAHRRPCRPDQQSAHNPAPIRTLPTVRMAAHTDQRSKTRR
jgi:hypothetical protein